MYIFKI